jgi:hypothetical protein
MTTGRKNNSLTINAIEGKIVPEEQTFQASLRQAIFDGVSTTDVSDVVKSIITKAKAGDVKAQKMMFDYILGAKSKPTQINVVNNFRDVEQAARMRRAE